MLLNYLKTTFRHIIRSKVSFVFKLGGLTLAISSLLVIAIYVSYQLSFDKYHIDYENVYRVNSVRKENGVREKFGIVPMALGPMLQAHIPDVTSCARIRGVNATYIRYDNRLTACEGLVEADTSIFGILYFRFLRGNKDALKRPNSIVLTKTMAMNVFGSIDVLQKLVSISNERELYEVTAIVDDVFTNSHLRPRALIPIREEHGFTLSSIVSPVEFVDHSATLYVRFREGQPHDFMARIESMLNGYVSKADRAASGFSIFLQPLEDIYLGPEYKYDFASRGSITYVYAFSILGLLLLLVAAINYINLCVADFNNRSRETGIRKVLGARKHQMILHVALETCTYITAALALGALLVYALFPYVLQLVDPNLRFGMLFERRVLTLIAVGLVILVGISVVFPSHQFVATKVTHNLKLLGAGYNSSISKVLLFTQFLISAVCICSTLWVGRQIAYIHGKDLGFDRRNLIVLTMPDHLSPRDMVVLKEELKAIAGVSSVSNSSFRIGGGYWKDWYFVEQEGEMKPVELYEVFSDDALFATLGMEVLQGRTFNAAVSSDSGAAFVINETAARQLGWEEPVGKRIYTHPEEKGRWDGTVVGVVSDININSLYEKVHPLVMRLPWQRDYPEYFVYVRYEGDEQSVIQAIERKYGEIVPGYPLAYRFVDELYNSAHRTESRAYASLQFGTLIVIIVSLLGMFSLAAYIGTKRMKEFGIRKVLGATVRQIAGTHIAYFMRIVLLSNLVALPVSYWLMKEWLSSFAYRIELTLLPFLVVVVLTFLLVVLSSGYSAWRAGCMNPVDVLRTE